MTPTPIDVRHQEVRPGARELLKPRPAEHRVAEQGGEEGQGTQREGVTTADAAASARAHQCTSAPAAAAAITLTTPGHGPGARRGHCQR